uniref:Pentraxin 4 n=1 Tax=Catagonus wagneri TaxID=51154 RepID=A0A8C3YPU1_9CETA
TRCPGGTSPPFFLFLIIFLPVSLHGALSREAGPVGQRKPFSERLRGPAEQFRRFQEVTLTHLQGLASNYNLSYDIKARFQSLAQENQAVALALGRSQAAVRDDLGRLKTWMRKTRRRSRKLAAWALRSSSRTPPPPTWSSSAPASSRACGPPSAARCAWPRATWAPSSPTPPKTTTASWFCTAATLWPPAPCTL